MIDILPDWDVRCSARRRPDLLADSFRHFPAGPQSRIAGLPVFAMSQMDQRDASLPS
jgi:hypothetical protein